jgi:hypothetical protein
MTKPDGWMKVDDFAGQQTWRATAMVTNPNMVGVALLAERTFTLTDVTLTTGKKFAAYTSKVAPVLPAGGDSSRPVILPGRTIEVAFELTLVRPTSIVATDVFAVAVPEFSPTVPTCYVPVAGAKPLSAATRGPRLCGQGGDFSDRETKAAIGIADPSDHPVCG